MRRRPSEIAAARMKVGEKTGKTENSLPLMKKHLLLKHMGSISSTLTTVYMLTIRSCSWTPNRLDVMTDVSQFQDKKCVFQAK